MNNTNTKRSNLKTIYKSASSTESGSADSVFIFLLILISFSSFSSLSSHVSLLRLLPQTFLSSFHLLFFFLLKEFWSFIPPELLLFSGNLIPQLGFTSSQEFAGLNYLFCLHILCLPAMWRVAAPSSVVLRRSSCCFRQQSALLP